MASDYTPPPPRARWADAGFWTLEELPNGELQLVAAGWTSFRVLAALIGVSVFSILMAGLVWLGVRSTGGSLALLVPSAVVVVGLVGTAVFAWMQRAASKAGTVLRLDAARRVVHVGSMAVSVAELREMVSVEIQYSGEDVQHKYSELHLLRSRTPNRVVVIRAIRSFRSIADRLSKAMSVGVRHEYYRMVRVGNEWKVETVASE